MTFPLSRLFQPKSVSVIGGGAWCQNVIQQLQKAKFTGFIWPVHPTHDLICGLPTYKDSNALPDSPDAAYVGINRTSTVPVIETLADLNAGGAVCFASGFNETQDGSVLNEQLLDAAGHMPILGPNCYGFINALDGVPLWPDQHGCSPVSTGVAILTQSSNIALNLTMQKRGLPIAYMVTCGNQAQISTAEIAANLLEDPRVTAIGLHIEGVKDLARWQHFARKAHAKNIPVVALKVGRSTQACAASISHTASLAGSTAGANALLDHLGIANVRDLPTFLETLKILHCGGPLQSNLVTSISCSGGEAGLIADLASDIDLKFPPLSKNQHGKLSKVLGPHVKLANPLDYHTYIWRNTAAMKDAFLAMIEPDIALTFLIVDFPRSDTCDPSDWDCAIQAAIQAQGETTGRIAMVATLPELMPEDVAKRLMDSGVIPLNGMNEALAAACAAQIQIPSRLDLIVPTSAQAGRILDEVSSKKELAQFGLEIPRSVCGSLDDIANFADINTGKFVLKTTGSVHKTETGGVVLGLTDANSVRAAGSNMASEPLLLEDQIEDATAELLIGIVKDEVHGFVLTIGAGGILAEVFEDTVSLLVPTDRDRIYQSLIHLKVAKLLNGYRGAPSADLAKILDAILAVQAYVLANIECVEEVEVNPLIANASRAIAVDAIIRKSDV